MKKIAAIFLALLFCLICPVVSFADDIYIVDDGEEEFIPDIQVTTTAPAETTTAENAGSIFGDIGSIDDYLSGLGGALGDGIDSILSGFKDNFGQLTPNNNTETTTPSLPSINSGERPTQSQYAGQLTTMTPEATTQQEQTTSAPNQNEELPSVLIVNNGSDDENVLSGSTLTLLVFVAAIVVLILAAAIVLVLMTRRTEYNSTVMDKSTIPSVEKPKAMSQFTNDNIGDDGNDYGNIAYWNDDSTN